MQILKYNNHDKNLHLHGLKHALILIIIFAFDPVRVNYMHRPSQVFPHLPLQQEQEAFLQSMDQDLGHAPPTLTNFIEFAGASTTSGEVAALLPVYKS